MTTTSTTHAKAPAKAKGPVQYRYVGIEDIRIGGMDVQYGATITTDHFAHINEDVFSGDKRFEKVSDKD